MVIEGMNKRGLSPVVATTLLISLVLVLAAIIFLWARAFLPETLQKLDGPIADACANVAFVAQYSSDSGSVTVQNNGNVPMQGIEVGIKRGIGSLEFVDVTPSQAVIVAGSSVPFSLSTQPQSGDQLIVTPVLLGKTSSDQLKVYVCGEEFAQNIQV
jgi:FlaG/FlaF family flagellin (archaellin)